MYVGMHTYMYITMYLAKYITKAFHWLWGEFAAQYIPGPLFRLTAEVVFSLSLIYSTPSYLLARYTCTRIQEHAVTTTAYTCACIWITWWVSPWLMYNKWICTHKWTHTTAIDYIKVGGGLNIYVHSCISSWWNNHWSSWDLPCAYTYDISTC